MKLMFTLIALTLFASVSNASVLCRSLSGGTAFSSYSSRHVGQSACPEYILVKHPYYSNGAVKVDFDSYKIQGDVSSCIYKTTSSTLVDPMAAVEDEYDGAVIYECQARKEPDSYGDHR
ncbi:MAG: hypothetical protein CL675_10895 [Bdellovibrionaceae bacterium]|nr:hypothetical protein [Pseudobdellovibrionaceae bacterium]